MELRQRRKVTKSEVFTERITELDAFPKVVPELQERSSGGGLVAIFTTCLILLILVTEISYFSNPKHKMSLVADTEFDVKLPLHIDITVATKCKLIGADNVDSTKQHVFSFGRLNYENTWFELDEIQRKHFDRIKSINQYLRAHHHSIREHMWKERDLLGHYEETPRRLVEYDDHLIPHDACRISGTLNLNKVKGVFHVTSGQSFPVGGGGESGHAHMLPMEDSMPSQMSHSSGGGISITIMEGGGFGIDLSGLLGGNPSKSVSLIQTPPEFRNVYNFSHRIDKFCFGEEGGSSNGIVQSLEGEEKIVEGGFAKFQYFISVVSTDIELERGVVRGALRSTYQYSVKDQTKVLKFNRGGHFAPFASINNDQIDSSGINFQYDVSPLKVRVMLDRRGLGHFLVRLAASIGGVIATSQFLYNFVSAFINFIM